MVSLGVDVTVCEDKQVLIEEVENFDCIVFSPGPGLPRDTKSLFPVLEKYAGSKKILGVCLGMQGIADFYGARLFNQEKVKHGVAESITIRQESKLFLNIPKEIEVGLYHSWAIDLKEATDLKVTGESESNIVMAFEHTELPIFGVQFHPESILTPKGKEILENFLFHC